MNGWLRASPVLILASALAACSEPAPPPEPLPTPPSITSFAADHTRIEAGGEAVLSFTTDHATEVEIVDQTAKSHPWTGTVASGQATVRPTVTSFYVLRVRGPGGSATSFLQVAVGEDLKEVFLVAVPPSIEAGEKVQLLWSAFNSKSATLTTTEGQQTVLDAARGSGSLEVAPPRSTTYTLTAEGSAEGSSLSREAAISVRPVLEAFAAAPAAANPGEVIDLSWKTRGAGSVTIEEATFGQLFRAEAPAEQPAVDAGAFAWTVPDQLPSGAKVLDGQPLRFTLTAADPSGAVTLTRTVQGHVGTGPVIRELLAPAAVSAGKPFVLSWQTRNAVRLEVVANGVPVHELLASETARMAVGELVLPGPLVDSVYELRIWSHLGVLASAQRTVRAVQLPSVGSFTLPVGVPAQGDAAEAAWTTTGATSVVIRVKDGPAVFREVNPAKVASGTTSLYPGVRTTFVLEAYNDANDKATAEATVNVVNGGVMTASPNPVVAGAPVTVDWTIDGAVAYQVFGDPEQTPIENHPYTDFLELADHVNATEVVFSDPEDGIVRLPLPAAFTFPIAGQIFSSFWVSTNGFVAPSRVGALSANVRLDVPTGIPPIVAPFWDDLRLGADGRVLWLLAGTEFPRRLVIQWESVETSSDAGSVLSFQVQLYETGEMRFAYRELSGADSNGQGASVGWRVDGTSNLERATGAPLLDAGDEYVFFDSGRTTAQITVTPQRSSVYSLVGKLISGRYIVYSAPVTAIVPGSVRVNEVMALPSATAPGGRWVELHNPTFERIELGGTALASAASATSWTLPAGLGIDPGQYLVVGESNDPAQTDGAEVAVVWSGLTVDGAQDDTLSLNAGAGAISSMTYAAADQVAGTSWPPPNTAIDSAGTQLTCARDTFGPNGAIGTPGRANEACFEYAVTPIPLNYPDISATGVQLFGGSWDDEISQIDISSAPFSYFGGAPSKVMSVCSNGWVSFTPTTDDQWTNKTLPSVDPDSPSATVAAFWDDLQYVGGALPASTTYVQRIAAGADPRAPVGHWIVQWHHVRHIGTSPADDLNFAAKFFDDGAIEFHYATMASGTSNNYANGNSATVWLERPDGDLAIPIGIDQAVIQPNTAYRFTPAN